MTDTVNPNYAYFADMPGLFADIPEESIVSRTVHKGDNAKVVLFGFAAGQYLSEHTSTQEAFLQIVQGDATLVIDGETHEASAGAWVRMAPNIKHSVVAKTPVIMLLYMVKPSE
jgi:quercetin dioxygenase-like cupin family protein